MSATAGTAPFPAFDWEAWYESVGGRRPRPAEFAELFGEMERVHLPLARAPPAPERRDLGPPAEAAAFVKRAAIDAGAEAVGVTVVRPEDVYAGRVVAEPVAVVLAKRMDVDVMLTAPSVPAAVEMARVYRDLGRACIALARLLRGLGHGATVQHPVIDMDVLFLPLAQRAGLGELGRHGSLIHPDLGACFRLGAVTTDAPLAIDAPLDVGIARFCEGCHACRSACPPAAISDAREDAPGGTRWLVDTDRCFPYFAANHYCGVCLAVCPFNRPAFRELFRTGRAPLPKRPAISVRPLARRVDVSRPAPGSPATIAGRAFVAEG